MSISPKPAMGQALPISSPVAQSRRAKRGSTASFCAPQGNHDGACRARPRPADRQPPGIRPARRRCGRSETGHDPGRGRAGREPITSLSGARLPAPPIRAPPQMAVAEGHCSRECVKGMALSAHGLTEFPMRQACIPHGVADLSATQCAATLRGIPLGRISMPKKGLRDRAHHGA